MGLDSMDSPFYSVIITTYNSRKTIGKTLKSVLNQTFKDYELIIIDDNSKDDTLMIINQFKEKENITVNVYRFATNRGVSFARNYGIEMSKGQYICFLDGDDIWLPNKLEVEAEYLKKDYIDWVCSNYNVIDESYNYKGKRIRESGLYTYKDIIKSGNPVGMLTVAIKKQILLNNKFQKLHHEDFDLWIRLSKQGYICFTIDNVLASYMKSKYSLSSNKIKSIFWTYKVFRCNGINVFVSFWLIVKYLFNALRRVKK